MIAGMRMMPWATMVFLLVLFPLWAEDTPAPTDDELAKILGAHEALQIIREADRIEGVRVKRDEKPEGNLPFDVVELGRLTEIDSKLAGRIRGLLGDRATYDTNDYDCGFSPGVKLIFHHEKLGDLEMLICLSCSELAVEPKAATQWRSLHKKGEYSDWKVHFGPGKAKVRQLMIDTFADNKDILELIAEEEAQLKKNREEEARWKATMPKSVRALWEQGNERWIPRLEEQDLPLYRAALKSEFPEAAQRILALLTWYGSADGDSFASWRKCDPANLLMDFSTVEIIRALESVTLTDSQAMGVARFFSSDQFERKRLGERTSLPAPLKKRLREQGLKSQDQWDRGAVRDAFGEQ